MSMKALSLLAGASLLGLVCAAQAGEPVALTADEMDQVTAGYVGYANVYKTIYDSIYARIDVGGVLHGNHAEGLADAGAFGSYGNYAFSGTNTLTDDFGAVSSSASVSHSGGPVYYPPCCHYPPHSRP
jgi:hypothetical protein